MAVKNDYSLIYRGLCFQIGNEQQGCKAIIVREFGEKKRALLIGPGNSMAQLGPTGQVTAEWAGGETRAWGSPLLWLARGASHH